MEGGGLGKGGWEDGRGREDGRRREGWGRRKRNGGGDGMYAEADRKLTNHLCVDEAWPSAAAAAAVGHPMRSLSLKPSLATLAHHHLPVGWLKYHTHTQL
jgi:hypothetical protein